MVARLIVISNRVAVPESASEASAGGLAVAVQAALSGREGIWFGWSGRITEETDHQPTIRKVGGTTYVVLDLAPGDFNEYYNGFANRVLWPILHYRLDLAEFTRSDLSGYQRVNNYFADRLSSILKPDDIVWVHDYHLMPLARLLRERGHQNRIGYFLHVPCPPPDILTALPKHREIVGALVAFDLIGLQTENDCENLTRYLLRQGARRAPDNHHLEANGRKVTLGAFPVGIETARFERTARRAAATALIKETAESLGGRSMVMSVDRLDYSKGLPNRMDAIERFLSTYSEWHGRVTFLQIAPKSRGEIHEYMEIDRQVSTLAGQINGLHGDVTWTPIRYVNKAYSRAALAGLYRLAKVGLVTPLRDGMNLVAKEYVVAQNSLDPGVLVLSQFAGAAEELDGALIVNPHEPEAVAAAIRFALEMPLDARQARYQRMMDVLRRNDIHDWTSRFLTTLEQARPTTTPAAATAEPPPESIAARASR
ncbi:MAG TPA: alpha,alpha-trehalose-phosphate synthase (UDP-forming) [Thermomicrobiales bacterium]|nr:alpha,alpha-trehalose-phosphate synthase (UDP-forming) [Thermomicrobiales bacterium]